MKTASTARLALALAFSAFGAAKAISMSDLGPRPVFPEPDLDRVRLGWMLFYDPVLSGNQNTTYATCHHPKFGTSDGVAPSLGEGAVGLGPHCNSDSFRANPVSVFVVPG